jgi:3-oxoacyl-[acyl-carrier-protein] synthase-3
MLIIMAQSKVSDMRIAGVASAVPRRTVLYDEYASWLGAEQARKISENIGVRARRVAGKATCTSDLCFAAAQRLMRELEWLPEQVAGILFVSQSPDYVLPATSYRLHSRLGLPDSCYALDINLGCSGYVYGLWVAASLMQTIRGRILLLVGDTSTRMISPQGQSVALLFGDAGTATALEPASDGETPMFFELGADGSGADSLIIPVGGFRRPRDETTAVRTVREGGSIRSDQDLFMDGPEIFSFSLARVPGLVQSVLHFAGRQLGEIDHVIFHQANRFMLLYLAKRIGIPADKFVVAMENFGNTSSASIPLAITTSPLRQQIQTSPTRLLLAGFGVGFSWAASVLSCGPAVCPELVEYDEPEASGDAERVVGVAG